MAEPLERNPIRPSPGGARMFFHDHRRALGYAVLMFLATSLLFVAVAADPVDPVVQPIDDWWYRAMNELRLPAVAFVARVFDIVGGARGNIPIRIGVGLVLVYRRNWPALAVWLLTWAFSEIAVNVSKSSIGRPRPPDSLVLTTTSSFPSGHATAGAATAVALVLVLLPPGRRRARWEWIAVAVTFLTALSRTYLNAHWLTDTIAGSLLGASIAIVSAGLVREWTELRMRRRGRSVPPRSSRRAGRLQEADRAPSSGAPGASGAPGGHGGRDSEDPMVPPAPG